MSDEECKTVSDKFNDVVITLGSFKKTITELQTQMRELEKSVKKEIKNVRKENNRKRAKKTPSGFAKPSKVSDELCLFMNKECGTEIARTEVTQFIISYIKNNYLQCEENKKIIKPDAKLRSLLSLNNKDEELTYFNLQKYMNRHFI